MELALKILRVLISVGAVATVALYERTDRRMDRTYEVTPAPVILPTDPALVERGRHLATAVFLCTDCHGEDLGGEVMMDNPFIGRIVASNLTRGEGGVGRSYTDADWERAVRHGLDPLGTPLVAMPSLDYQHLSDGDLAAIVAFIRQAPPVDREPPPMNVGPGMRVALATGMMPVLAAERIEHGAVGGDAPEPGPTPTYGAYLASACRGCHGPSLDGGKGAIPGAPGITMRRLGPWSEADFFRALRQGVRPDGTPISTSMPWPALSQMTDEEIRALWLYLRTTAPQEPPPVAHP